MEGGVRPAGKDATGVEVTEWLPKTALPPSRMDGQGGMVSVQAVVPLLHMDTRGKLKC